MTLRIMRLEERIVMDAAAPAALADAAGDALDASDGQADALDNAHENGVNDGNGDLAQVVSADTAADASDSTADPSGQEASDWMGQEASSSDTSADDSAAGAAESASSHTAEFSGQDGASDSQGQADAGPQDSQSSGDPLAATAAADQAEKDLREAEETTASDEAVNLGGGDADAGDGEPIRVLAISSSVSDAEDLAKAATDNVITVIYDSELTTEQIIDEINALVGDTKVESIALATHSTQDGQINLSAGYEVNYDTLQTNSELSVFFEALGSMIESDGRIDILTCDVAANPDGQGLVEDLEGISGVNVAASDDATGNLEYGGDWVLETDGVDLVGDYFDPAKLYAFEGVLENAAPVLATAGGQNLTSITEDDADNAGNTVSEIVGATISDVDAGDSEGIAIHTQDASNGTWQYKLSAGGDWTAFGAVAEGSALLLGSADSVRFVPNTENGTTASFDYYAWDATSGAAGAKADAGTRGGSSSFSDAGDQASITVTAVNDAPVLTPTGTTLSEITEDATDNAGNTVADIVGATIDDVDTGAVEGIAIYDQDDGYPAGEPAGTWQYKLSAGGDWTAFGAVAEGSALLLGSADSVRFVPNTENGTTATFDYYAWDATSGAAGDKADAGTRGDATAFSDASDQASITVTAVNDAPVLTPTGTTLSEITEDATDNAGNTVSEIVGATISDVDAGAVEGIAIHDQAESNGTWQYKLSAGGDWTDFGAVAEGSALLLGSADSVRFVPDGENADSASFDYYAWDTTSGSAGDKADAGTRGDATAFSDASDQASITVTAVNDAPVLTPTGTTLSEITEDATDNAGNTVADIVGATIDDVDTGAVEGIAIYDQDDGYPAGEPAGTWQYKLSAGGDWTAFGAVAEGSALLLGSADSVRFVPNTENGTTATFDYYAWDATSGAAGDKADAGTRGDATAFSDASDQASITVTAVNDAPVLTPTGTTLSEITEDATDNAGNTVSEIVGATISDVDAGAVEGIAIHDQAESNGTWQYKLSAGGDWTDFGAVTEGSALLLGSADSVRFVPDGENADSASFDYYAWDTTSGSAGDKADAGTRGGSSSFSDAGDQASITVTAVNDAPVLTPTGTTLSEITEDATDNAGNTVSEIVGATISDVDAGAVEGIAIHDQAESNGTWQYKLSAGGDWTDFGAVTEGSALLLGSADSVRFVPDGENADSASFDYYAWDTTSGSAGDKADAGTRGDATAFSDASDQASITVTAVNDAPVLTPTGTTLSEITEDATDNAGNTVSEIVGATISDVDAGAVEGIAIHDQAESNGTWQYKLSAGGDWTDFGAVTEGSALLLGSADSVRFVPDGENADSASFDYYAWDTTSGSAGDKADAGTRGDATAFSDASDQASITVTAVNDAPVLTPTGTTLSEITEDATDNAGNTVADIVGATIDDVDTGAVEGIAIYDQDDGYPAGEPAGTWQYKLSAGGDWTAFGAVAEGSALLLGSADSVRFVPNTENGTTATFDYYAWDATSGAAGDKADAGTRGDATVFSDAGDQASITVTDVNDRPGVTTLEAKVFQIEEGDAATNTAGDVPGIAAKTVADLLGYSDDSPVKGVAITSVGDDTGTWQYSTDGNQWWDFQPNEENPLNDGNALLLLSTDMVRYVPSAYDAGDPTSIDGQFSYYEWANNTVPTAYNHSDIYDSDGNLIDNFSGAASYDFPNLSDATYQGPMVTDNAGILVQDIVGDATEEGLAIFATDDGTASNKSGTWQYSPNGKDWYDFGPTGKDSAVLLPNDYYIRLVNGGDDPSIDYALWDRAGQADRDSMHADLTDAGLVAYFTDKGTDYTFDGASELTTNVLADKGVEVDQLTDADSTSIAITGIDANGDWQYSADRVNWFDFGTVGEDSALLLPSDYFIRQQNNGGGTPEIEFAVWDRADYADDEPAVAYNRVDAGQFNTSEQTYNLDNYVADPSGLNGVEIASDITNHDIAVLFSSSDIGTWQYKVVGGDWRDFGDTSLESALVLAKGSFIRFIPNSGTTNHQGSFTYVPYDGASQGDVVNLSTDDVHHLADITEDAAGGAGATSQEYQVYMLTGQVMGDQFDSQLLGGIAIYAKTTKNGYWEYSIDGGDNWNALGAVDTTDAVLLRNADLLRYVLTDTSADGSGTLNYLPWDPNADAGTAGEAGKANTADVSTDYRGTDEGNAFGNQGYEVSLAVDANQGQQVSDILDGMFTEVDTNDHMGIKVVATYFADPYCDTTITDLPTNIEGYTFANYSGDDFTANSANLTPIKFSEVFVDGTNTTIIDSDYVAVFFDCSNGTWKYYQEDTATWVDVADTGSGEAVVLDKEAILTFIPKAGVSADAGYFQYAQYDNPNGVTSNTAEEVAVGGQEILPTTYEGTWQYSTDGGATWIDMINGDDGTTAISAANPLSLSHTDKVRFVPDGMNPTQATLEYYLWDQSGAADELSAATTKAVVNVQGVNDAPLKTVLVDKGSWGEGNTLFRAVSYDVDIVDNPESKLNYRLLDKEGEPSTGGILAFEGNELQSVALPSGVAGGESEIYTFSVVTTDNGYDATQIYPIQAEDVRQPSSGEYNITYTQGKTNIGVGTEPEPTVEASEQPGYIPSDPVTFVPEATPSYTQNYVSDPNRWLYEGDRDSWRTSGGDRWYFDDEGANLSLLNLEQLDAADKVLERLQSLAAGGALAEIFGSGDKTPAEAVAAAKELLNSRIEVLALQPEVRTVLMNINGMVLDLILTKPSPNALADCQVCVGSLSAVINMVFGEGTPPLAQRMVAVWTDLLQKVLGDLALSGYDTSGAMTQLNQIRDSMNQARANNA